MTIDHHLRVGLIGPGRISIAHLDAITSDSSRATLVAVGGLPEEASRTQTVAEQFGAERAVHSIDDIIHATDIDAVVLTVPNHIHATITVRLLEAGKHVLVEKPLTNTVVEADSMVAAAEKARRVLMVGQCRRFFDGARRAKELCSGLGSPLTLTHYLGVFVREAATDWWKHAQEAGGLAVGLNGPHVIDTMLWLIDSKPMRVYAQTRRLRDLWEGEDEAAFIIDFEDGSIATGCISLNARAPVNMRWVNGPEGTIQLADDRNLWLNGERIITQEVTPYIEGDVSFRAQFREFVSAVREGRQPLSSAVEARQVVAVMEAIQASQDKGGPVLL